MNGKRCSEYQKSSWRRYNFPPLIEGASPLTKVSTTHTNQTKKETKGSLGAGGRERLGTCY